MDTALKIRQDHRIHWIDRIASQALAFILSIRAILLSCQKNQSNNLQ